MKETLYSRRSNLVVGFHGCDQSIKEQVFEHLARLVAVADLSEENRIAYDKALDRYRVNQIVEEDERRKNEEMRRKGIGGYRTTRFTLSSTLSVCSRIHS